MDEEQLNISSFYKTSDLGCTTAISLWFPIETVDRSNPGKAVFLFKKSDELDRFLEEYWKGEVRVEPQIYFAQLRAIKSRLYSSEGEGVDANAGQNGNSYQTKSSRMGDSTKENSKMVKKT